jgi:hypothetical protein
LDDRVFGLRSARETDPFVEVAGAVLVSIPASAEIVVTVHDLLGAAQPSVSDAMAIEAGRFNRIVGRRFVLFQCDDCQLKPLIPCNRHDRVRFIADEIRIYRQFEAGRKF